MYAPADGRDHGCIISSNIDEYVLLLGGLIRGEYSKISLDPDSKLQFHTSICHRSSEEIPRPEAGMDGHDLVNRSALFVMQGTMYLTI